MPAPNRFSSRLPWPAEPNPLTLAYRAHREAGRRLLDLTETNPTRAGLPYDADSILRDLSRPEVMTYDPDPRGLRSAREAVAAYYGSHGRTVDPESLFLTGSTSEAYAQVFKLLADPGDEILVPRPSYPLFEHLTALEGLRTRDYPLVYAEDRGWGIGWDGLAAAAGPRARAVVAVNPNNPTGSYLGTEDRARLSAFCAERGLALIVDEVFLDFPSPAFAEAASTAAGNEAALTFVLSGLSKVAALPQLKLGWIAVSGPAAAAAEAGERLEFVADAYLSANAPVQHAAPHILAGREAIQVAIRDRLERNSAALIAGDLVRSGFHPLRREGGWYGVVRMPPGRDEEETVLRLLERGGVWVHPGYFYDFEENDTLVVSLLTAPEVFAEGLVRAARILAEDP